MSDRHAVRNDRPLEAGPVVDLSDPKIQEINGSGLVIDLRRLETQTRDEARPQLTDQAALLVASNWELGVKRFVDVVLAATALVVLSPILLLTAVGIKLTSPGSVIFRQTRVGKNGEEFQFYKFRSMHIDAESMKEKLLDRNESTGPVFKIKGDPRLTNVGSFIRRSSIDELPQLWNVMQGEMSLVGPRPPIPSEVKEYSEWEMQRLAVNPGITCIWQVSGRSDVDFENWVRLDIDYIEHWSLLLDLKLLAKTIPAVLSGKGAY